MALATLVVLSAQAQNITTVAGDGTRGFAGDGGLATNAKLSDPTGLAFDSTGNLYVADQLNARVRMVNPSGNISTLAGNGSEGYSGDGGPATNAQLNYPIGMAVGSANGVYVSQYQNSVIRKIASDNTISTLAGNGSFSYSGDGGPATDAALSYVQGVATDSAGNLYIVDAGNQRIRKVDTSGIISTVVGTGVPGFSGDGGLATAAQLRDPARIAVDRAGNLYITDAGNRRVRKVTTSGMISTVAGNGTAGFSGDGGPATSAQLRWPYGLAVDESGNLFITDLEDHRIRKVDTSGVITTIAGDGTPGFSGDGGPAATAQLNTPIDLAVRGADLYVSDAVNQRVRRIGGAAQVAAVEQATPVPTFSPMTPMLLTLVILGLATIMSTGRKR